MKARKFLKTLPMKFYLLLLAVVLFSFFSNDFGLVDIQKTAVILAAGIDKTESGFSLTAQIAVPKGSDRSQGGTSSVDIQSEGETVSDCVSNIFSETGWVPKLVFINLIVIGEDAAKEDVVSYLNYFLRNEYMNDSCHLAVCEGTAHDLLSSKSATDDTSALAIQKLFSTAAEKSGKVMPNTLKDFAIGYYGVSKSSYLPYVRAKNQTGSTHGDAENTSGGGSGGGSGGSQGSSGSQTEQEKIYLAEETALFSEGKLVAVLPPEQTLAFSLLNGNVVSGTFNVKEKSGEAVTLTVIENGGGVKIDMKGAPRVKMKIDLTVRLCCRGTTAPIEDISTDDVKPELLDSAKEVLTGYVQALWQTGKESGCDLFHLQRDVYRSSLKKYKEWKDYLLDAAQPEIEASVRSLR